MCAEGILPVAGVADKGTAGAARLPQAARDAAGGKAGGRPGEGDRRIVTGMAQRNLGPTGTLLGVWAHPDDESYLSGGLMARAAEVGERVVVAMATRGERGTDDPRAWPPHRLADQRARELRTALERLGVREHHWLGHVDGTLPGVPAAVAVAQLTGLIERVEPDTVVTFGPDGVTGHEDHRAVGAWTTAAWEALGRPCRLWYAALDEDFHRDWGQLAARHGVWMTPLPPRPAAAADLVGQLRLDPALVARKVAAIEAHGSQSAGLIAAVGEELFRRWWAVESFVAAAEVGAQVGAEDLAAQPAAG